MCASLCVGAHVYTCECVCVHVHMYKCVCACECVCVHVGVSGGGVNECSSSAWLRSISCLGLMNTEKLSMPTPSSQAEHTALSPSEKEPHMASSHVKNVGLLKPDSLVQNAMRTMLTKGIKTAVCFGWLLPTLFSTTLPLISVFPAWPLSVG